MLQAKIYVSMLGTMSITWNGQSITEKDSRSRKTWLLLAYLIHERSRHIKQQEIIRLLWDEKEEQTNPQGSQKTALHRLRSMLNKLNESAGHQLILRQDSSYAWNPQYELEYDVRFSRHCTGKLLQHRRTIFVWHTVCRPYVSIREIFCRFSVRSHGCSRFLQNITPCIWNW